MSSFLEVLTTSLKTTAQSFLKHQKKSARPKRNRDEAVVRVVCVLYPDDVAPHTLYPMISSIFPPSGIHFTYYTPQEVTADSELGEVVMMFVAPSTFPPSIARDAIRAVATEINYVYPSSLSDETVVTLFGPGKLSPYKEEAPHHPVAVLPLTTTSAVIVDKRPLDPCRHASAQTEPVTPPLKTPLNVTCPHCHVVLLAADSSAADSIQYLDDCWELCAGYPLHLNQSNVVVVVASQVPPTTLPCPSQHSHIVHKEHPGRVMLLNPTTSPSGVVSYCMTASNSIVTPLFCSRCLAAASRSSLSVVRPVGFIMTAGRLSTQPKVIFPVELLNWAANEEATRLHAATCVSPAVYTDVSPCTPTPTAVQTTPMRSRDTNQVSSVQPHSSNHPPVGRWSPVPQHQQHQQHQQQPSTPQRSTTPVSTTRAVRSLFPSSPNVQPTLLFQN